MTQTPNLPPLIESIRDEYSDSGITSTAAIAGHPIHPLLVLFPIAFLVAAFGTDLGYWLTRDPFWARASIWLIGAGFISGIVAAIPGLMDFIGITRVRKRSAGWFHLIANIVILSLSLVNWILRLGNLTGSIIPVGSIISTIVAVLLGLSGWYGAELIYRHKVAVIGYNSRHED
jgi:uncharacterized membrane protein